MVIKKGTLEVIKLVLQIILLIVMDELDPKEATKSISKKAGVGFMKLWTILPSKYK